MTSFQQFPIYKVTVRDPAGLVDLITFLSPADLDLVGGVPPEVVVGKLLGPGTELIPDNFARNRAFVDFLHDVISTTVPQIEEFVAAAKHQGIGWLNIHDARAFNVDRELASRDIIGSFRVEGGVIIGSSYTRNRDHRILSEHGMLTPHPAIQEQILSAMRRLRFKPETTE